MNKVTKGAISEAYFTKGAYLVNAHGMLASPNKIKQKVPPNTVIYFLAEPGYCLNIPTTLGIQNEFFTSRQKLFNFLYRAGNPVGKPRSTKITHVHNINTRIKKPGEKYLDMYLNVVPNKKWPTMGYIKKLPTKPSHIVPTYRNIIKLNNPGRYLLSNLLKTKFKNGGVIIISACRAIPNNIHRFKEPGLPRQRLPRGTGYTEHILRNYNATPLIKGRPFTAETETLGPFVKKTVNKRKYPPKILVKLRQAVAKGMSVNNALNKYAEANLSTRQPGELNFLKTQQRLASSSPSNVMVLRSKTKLNRPRTAH
jgi:hypothetical protein